MALETLRARRNEAIQRAAGGIEPPDDVYKMMQVAYPAAFLAMIAEGAARGDASPSWLAAGIVVFAAAKALKYWAIVSLGDSWTFRVIVRPSHRVVMTGPYRFVRHPNYVGVIGELAGVALMSGAIISGPIAMLAFSALIAKRIAVEERALADARRA